MILERQTIHNLGQGKFFSWTVKAEDLPGKIFSLLWDPTRCILFVFASVNDNDDEQDEKR